ncbi:MAG: M18 family aminopeptidase [Oscillospiraceae bacterium]|nr:M18 family aminopeptidase [Oscillospiraceae bacterium]
MNKKLFDFIAKSPTPYHAVKNVCDELSAKGYTELSESKKWNLEPGKGYYVTRNCSSVIAFRVPEEDFSGFMLTASHCDSPCFKIKENAELADRVYVRLSTEKYGGMLCSTWLDRPLAIAGRITVRTEDGISVSLVDTKEPCAIIPNVAIHMNRSANDNMSYNPAVDMLPLFCEGDEKGSFRALIAKTAGCEEKDILTTDLVVYNPQYGTEWNGFISAPRLDDLQCAFGALEAFTSAKKAKNLPVYCLFDNEEVGSQTKQGAASTFIACVLERISECLGLSSSEHYGKIANSFMLSCDNAHAVHPNHPEYQDKNHAVYINKGIVIKYNANQRYTSDAVSAAIFQLVCEEAGVPFQRYANRADMPGGSTLGNIANTQVSLNTVDIGLPQLAMHSSYETAGAKDTGYYVKALSRFYEKSLLMESDGNYKFI